MAAHVPEYIKSTKLKNVLDEDGEPKKWSSGEIVLVQIGDVFEKYCCTHPKTKKFKFNYFIHYSLFIPHIEYNNQKRIEKANTPEALHLTKVVNDIKRAGCCCICRYKENIKALIFDHVEPDKKSADVSDLVHRYRLASNKKRPAIFQKTMEEISKCVIMCANCHSIKTFNNKCGREKLKKYYVSPEDFLIRNNKSTVIQQTLYNDEYEIGEQKIEFAKPNFLQENDIKIDIISNELCADI